MKKQGMRKQIEDILNEKVRLFLNRVDIFQNRLLKEIDGLRQVDELLRVEVPSHLDEDEAEDVGKLHDNVKKISSSVNQMNLINNLLDGINMFCGRAALFLIRDDKLVGWKGKGFSGKDGEISDEELKKVFFSLSANTILKQVLDKKKLYFGSPQSAPDDFLIYNRFGGQKPESIFVLPFFVKGKAQAVIYTDSNLGQAIRRKQIEILATVGELSLDLIPIRQKILSRVKTHEFIEEAEKEGVEELQIEPREHREHEEEQEKTTLSVKESDPARLARVIVNDIILYNQPLIEEGLRNKNLSELLRETLLQAKEMYLTKFGDLRYFEEQLINNLARGSREALKGYRFEVFK